MRARLSGLSMGIAALSGWRRALAAALLGALGTLALSPVDAAPVLIVSFTGLVRLLDGAPRGRTAFWTGWWFAFGYHVIGLYWISNALFIDIGRFFWLLPPTVTGLPAFLAIYGGLACWAAWRLGRLGRCAGMARVPLLAATWGVSEWLRGHLFTGFPWNLHAYAWSDWTAPLQAAALVGAYGLTLLTVIWAAAPAMLVDAGGRRTARGPAALALAWGSLAALWTWGMVRLGDDAGTVPDMVVRIVQASIPQKLKWSGDHRGEIFRRQLELSAAPGLDKVKVLVWPETAAPFFLGEEPEARRALGDMVPPGGLAITGALRGEWGPDNRLRRVWNSLYALDHAGTVAGTYDKFHLVPFGEYVPARGLLAPLGLSKITAGTLDFSAGPGPRTLDLPGVPPVSPLICYEAIFPGEVADPRERPGWMLNVTNDGWYGRTAGPHQHLAIARMRAVEEGVPLVRAANNGISAVFDAHGRERGELGLDVAGVLDIPLPKSLATPPPYARYGDIFFWILAAAALMSAMRQRVRLS